MGWRLLVIAQNMSYSSEITSTMRISHKMLPQNERFEVQFPQIMVFVLSKSQHRNVTLFESTSF